MGLGSGGITLRCGVGCRRSLDLMVLVTVAYTPAVVGLIRPLAREPPYDVGGGGGEAAAKAQGRKTIRMLRGTPGDLTATTSHDHGCQPTPEPKKCRIK